VCARARGRHRPHPRRAGEFRVLEDNLRTLSGVNSSQSGGSKDTWGLAGNDSAADADRPGLLLPTAESGAQMLDRGNDYVDVPPLKVAHCGVGSQSLGVAV